MLLKLLLSNFAARRMRVALTVAAVALSVSLVVSVTGGFATINRVAQRFLTQVMGSTDATIARSTDARAGVDEIIVTQLQADKDVQAAVGRLETDATLLDKNDRPLPGRATQVVGIRRPFDREVDRLQINAGKWFDSSDETSVVIDQVVAENLKLRVGDTLKLANINGPLSLTVTGVVQKPGILAAQIQTVYLPLATLQRYAMPNAPGRVGKILIDLKPGVDERTFEARWKQQLAAIDPAIKLKLTSTYREDMDQQLASMDIMAYLAGMVSMLAATFIVFSALSMGVTERQRTLAMLRAVGAFKYQVGLLVIVEGLLLAAMGVAIGIPLGWLWLQILVHIPKFKEILGNVDVTLAPGGLWMAGLGSILAAAVASLLPAYMATRVDPLDAMRPLANTDPGRLPIGATLAGLLLIFIDTFILFGPLGPVFASSPLQAIARAVDITEPLQFDRTARFYLHFVLGLPSLFIGFFLLAPIFVWLTERLLGPLVALVMRVQFPILRQQLSASIWRAAGTCAALMVGLAILVVMQVQGHSALNSWKLPDKFPDVFIFSPVALTPADQQKLADTPGIRAGELMPIAIASPQFGSNLFAIAGAMVLPDATMFFGIDPDKSLHMMELEFRDDEGRRVNEKQQKQMAYDATQLLKKGRHVIVTDEFRQLRGLKRGDVIPLKTARNGTVDFKIAGIVWSPGMDVINSKFDLGRQFEQRTAASLFGSLEDARNEFGVQDIYLFAANLDYFMERDRMLNAVQNRLGRMNMKIGDVRQIKKGIQDGLGNLLLLVSSVAFAAMAVASLGVTNTIMASIRSRQWQFGVLRSIGVTRGQLLRVIICEAILLGLVGIILGLTAGFLMSVNGRQFLVVTTGFVTTVTIPWGIIWVGVGVVGGISLLASIVPAVQVARTQPLDLLQAGRSAS